MGTQGDARAAPRARHLRVLRARVGAAAAGRPGGRGDDGGWCRRWEPRTLRMFADWTDRIAAGEVPPTPPRPQGIERNVVITLWDWADPKAYLHDLVSTDRRNPTVNANGPVYAVLEASADYMPVLDPKTHTVEPDPGHAPRPERRPRRRRRSRAPRRTGGPSRSGPAGRTCTTRCSTRRGASGSPPGCVRRRTPPSARRGRAIRRPASSRSTRRAATWRCTTRGRRR
jgi:hypothetical protein